MMTRQRTIHPDIWQDERIAQMNAVERLLFCGIISIADDEGRLPASPAYLRGQLYPHDERVTTEHVRTWLDGVLAKNPNVLRYHAGDIEYLALLRWRNYQKIGKPQSRIPAPPDAEVASHLTPVFKQPALLETHEDKTIAAVLATLRKVLNYPTDMSRDAELVTELRTDFPTLDLPKSAKDWATYKLDRPLASGSNARSQFRMWCNKQVEFQQRDAAVNGKPAQLEDWREQIAHKKQVRERARLRTA